MSVNRDPKVGDRFTWSDGRPAVRVVTRVDGYRVYHRFEYFDDSIQYPTRIKDWRADASLVDPDLDERSLLDIALDHVVDGDNNVVVFRLDAGGGDYDFAEIEVERP